MTAPEPPSGGWTVAEAAAALLPQKHAEATELPPKDWWMVGGTYRKRERDEFRLAFRRLMEGDSYVADGVPFGKAEPEVISARHWRSAMFHLGLPGEPELPREFSVGMHSWSGVRIKRAHAAVMAAPVDHDSEDRLPTDGPELAELPAWWTLDQACVWIALRDTAAVLDAGKPSHRRNTLGIIGWHLEWASRKGDQPVGPNPSEADDLIVAVARRGAIQSSGRRGTDPDRRPIETEDWALATIAEDRHANGGKYLAPEGEGIHHWRGVLMARGDMAREWPPFGFEASPPVELPDIVPEVVRVGMGTERRLERWLVEQMRKAPDAPVPKPEMQARAIEGGFTVSDRGFHRAWANAVEASGALAWALPGRRKSPQ